MISFDPRRSALLARFAALSCWQSVWWRRARRLLLWGAVALYFGFCAIFLTLRYAVLPNITEYRGDLERALTASLHLPVTVGKLEADWQGLRPRLMIGKLQVSDNEGRPALSLDNVEAIVGWTSVFYLEPRMYRLEIVAPNLVVRREKGGQIFVAGLPLNTESEDSRFADWLLTQHQVVIRDATVSWLDEKRSAPALELNKVNFNLTNTGSHHRFGLTAEPPSALASRLDIRGDFKGRDPNELESWKGQVYADLDYTDLAVWHTWLDYPLDLPRGTGGVRLWMNFLHKQPVSMTADLSLSNVDLRLAPELPMLMLDKLNGRIAASRSEQGFVLEGRQLALQTHDGLSVPANDFRVAYSFNANNEIGAVESKFQQLDIDTLIKLSGYLPMTPVQREHLATYAPHGRFQDFSLSWDGAKKYSIKGRFNGLGMAAQGHLPGVNGLSGSIDGNDEGGEVIIDSRDLALDVPTIFAEPKLDFTKLAARMHWKRKGDDYDITLDNVTLNNKDLTGTFSGRYRGTGSKPGVIDLTGQLTRADGTAVWRYLPLAVNKNAREWVRNGIVSGGSNDVKLTLKGDLKHFPFRDGGGTFKVAIKAHDAEINPAHAWPNIQHIDGDVVFEGVSLKINATEGKILGANLSSVKVEMPDLDTHEEWLTIVGKGQGATQEFLKFIEASPVGERIGHFTAPMTATGNGTLDLKLVLPLHDLDKSKVDGVYAFDNNRLSPDPALPALTEVKGKLSFTGDSLSARDVKANILGGPVTVNVATNKTGQLEVTTDGQYSIATMRRLYPMPLFDQLTGGGRWKGNININKTDVDVKITSDLIGLSSNLPEPFNKSAASVLEFRFERKPAPVEMLKSLRKGGKKGVDAPPPGRRELSEIVVGKLVRGQFVRRLLDNGTSEVERGYLNVGAVDAAAQRVPDRGVLLNANFAKVDTDFWRRMFSRSTTNDKAVTDKTATEKADTPIPFTQMDLRASELVALNRTIHDARLLGSLNGSAWKGDFKSREIAATLEWTPGVGDRPGRITGRIPQLSIPDPNAQVVAMSSPDVKQLPALALTIDKLNLRGKDWGEVKLDAENRSGLWNLKFSVNNEDANLSGEGRWRPDLTAPDTQLDFKLKAKSIERLLGRIGYVEAVRRGTAAIEGSLTWNSAPFSPDYPSMNGSLHVDLQNGQFNKLEPGIGRLLGILSLQSLPRRITLDFRDIFSDGFAFDSIRGQFAINKGVMDTQELEIKGPAAKVLMKGNVNLAQETQDLRVRVQPAVSESLAVGTMIANPVAGAMIWLGSKVLRDPVDKIFGFEYSVTGSWADPKVVKVDGNTPSTDKDASKDSIKDATKSAPAVSDVKP